MDATDSIGGVSLESYAVVRAALAEGVSLAEARAAARVDGAAWAEADLGWKLRFAAPEGRPALDRYRARLAEAEDALGRRVSPIDEDPAAWIAFLGAFGAAAEPASVLEEAGLGPNDLARLGRAWERRIARDAALAKRIGELRKKPPGAMPVVRPGPLARPLVGTPKVSAEILSSPPDASPVPAASAREGVVSPPGNVPVPAAPSYLREAARPQPSFVIAGASGAPPAPGATPAPGGAGGMPERRAGRHPVFARTQEASHAPLAAPLPFAPGNKAPLGSPSAGSAKHHVFARTQEASHAPLAAPLPFARARAPEPGTPASGRDAPGAAGGTVAPEAAGGAAKVPVRGSARNHPLGRRIDADKASPPAPPDKPAPSGEETLEPTKSPLRGVLPFSGAPSAAPGAAASESGASPPSVGAPGGSSAPAFSMERYASLTVELAEYPAHAAAVLHRYGLTADRRAALDARFRSEIARPEGRVAFDRACAAYRAWLRGER